MLLPAAFCDLRLPCISNEMSGDCVNKDPYFWRKITFFLRIIFLSFFVVEKYVFSVTYSSYS